MMKAQIQRSQIKMLFVMNLFVLLIQLLVAAVNGAWGTEELLKRMLSSLLYVNTTAVPALLILPPLFERWTERKLPIIPITILWLLLFILAGCLASQALLWAFGVLRLQKFWLYYLRTLPPILSAALIFGLGAFMVASLQKRLQDTERKLQEKAFLEERAQKLATEARLRSLESRLHPHFLFNALNSISSLVTENPELAERTVGRLAALLRASLDHSQQPLIPLREESAMIADYLEIERVRFGDKLQASMQIPDALQESKVPPLSILSLVENAVKHGITSKPGRGELLVTASIEESPGQLILEVRDSGAGFDLASIPAGHGLDNLAERLNTLFGDRAFLKVMKRDGWCIVQIGIPPS